MGTPATGTAKDPIPETIRRIREAVLAMGPGPLTEAGLREHVFGLFNRVLARDEIYLANHSLGRPLDALADDLAEYTAGWYDQMDNAWGPWVAECDAYRARVARLIGCARPDAVVPKASAGQGLRAVLNAIRPKNPDGVLRVVTTRGEFDSIDFILKAYAKKGRAHITWVEPDADGMFHVEHLLGALSAQTDLVVCSRVFFATGQSLQGVDRLVAGAREHGAMTLLDVYHATGVIPVGFDESGADFAIGGNYKYTRGGAGACWLAIRAGLLRGDTDPQPASGGLFTLDTGWFAKKDTFSYVRAEEPELQPGGDAWLEATPPVATYYQARSGLELTLALGVDRLRAYSLSQQQHLIDALASQGIQTKPVEHRGAFVLVPVADGQAAQDALKAAGVNVDARPVPRTDTHCVRLCPDILNTREELDRAAQIVAHVLG
ncbi:MAG: kynureninase [Phycisphaerales bacterium]|jgi:kynureninase